MRILRWKQVPNKLPFKDGAYPLDSHFNSLTFKIAVGWKLVHLATLSISNICRVLSVNKLRILKGQF